MKRFREKLAYLFYTVTVTVIRNLRKNVKCRLNAKLSKNVYNYENLSRFLLI